MDLEREKQIGKPPERTPSGDVTKSLPENTVGAQITFNNVVYMGLFTGKLIFALDLEY